MFDDENNNLPSMYEAEEAALAKLPDDRSALSTSVRENLREILRAMIESAKGVSYEKRLVRKDGLMESTETIVYKERPNMDVAQYLLNQLMGKPRETQVDFQIKQNIIVQNEIQIKKMDYANPS